MIANYHTHTYRCGHADGHEGEYVEQAVKKGLEILGFSDHTPYDFYDCEPRRRAIRMKPEELSGYVSSIRSLAEQYRDDIIIHPGLEVEYYPKYFPRLLEMIRETEVEYIILGQHFIFNEIDGGDYIGWPFYDEARLRQYVSQTSEALETGFFTYFAHPDLPGFQGDNDLYAEEMRKICKAAKATSTPLEINLLGLRDDRNYPDERFWKLAGEEGNEIILGSDAHRPQDVLDLPSIERAFRLADRYSLQIIDTVTFKHPWIEKNR